MVAKNFLVGYAPKPPKARPSISLQGPSWLSTALWLRDDSGDLPVDAFASLPFGFGVRMCLGRRLAELELQILLIKILLKFDLRLPEGHVVEPYIRGTTIPDKPIRVKFVDRI